VRRPDTLELFELVGVGPGMRCLDLGCGGGEVTFDLARLVEPGGRVTGIDMDEVKLELARAAAAERGIANVEFRSANVNDWSEPDTYDLVYCRFLLQHLSRPVDLLARMWASVRAGGAIVVEDADFDGLFCDPPNDGFEFYSRIYPQVLARRGGDHAIGRKLCRYFLEAGIPEPGFRLRQSTGSDSDFKALAYSTLDAFAEAALEEGVATEAELQAALASLEAFARDPATIVGDPRTFQVWRRR
jgi:ubiquinone/menaquinone biosynthesis C-methylase UbiE